MDKYSQLPRVVHVLDEYKIVINKGSNDDVKSGQRFLLFGVSSEPLLDPLTGEELDYLEIVRGTGKVSHVQERICTIVSDQKIKSASTKKVIKRSNPLFGGSEEIVENPEELAAPFDEVKQGDYAKPI